MPVPTPPLTLESVLKRIDQLEKDISKAKSEIKRKDQIITALQKRLFGSKSERFDPDQTQLNFEETILGKPNRPVKRASH